MEVKVTRNYSRTLEIKKPDGTSVWIKHEAGAEALVHSEIMGQTFKDLEEVCMEEVSTAIRNERAKIEASFSPKPVSADEPFSSEPSVTSSLANLPKL